MSDGNSEISHAFTEEDRGRRRSWAFGLGGDNNDRRRGDHNQRSDNADNDLSCPGGGGGGCEGGDWGENPGKNDLGGSRRHGVGGRGVDPVGQPPPDPPSWKTSAMFAMCDSCTETASIANTNDHKTTC